MKVRWSRLAMEDMQALRGYISEHDPVAAQEMAQTIVSNVDKFLPGSPDLGRPGRVPATREFVIAHTPFVVPYRVRGQIIQILRVYHAARSWPEKL
jgi:toxin ParE1/3/4